MDGSIHLQQQHLGGITAGMNQLQLQPAQQQFSIQQQPGQQRVVRVSLLDHKYIYRV